MLLLDTHIWWWSLSEPERLSPAALKAIRQTKANQRAISSISIWEFAMMVSRGRIELHMAPEAWLSRALGTTGLKVLELSAGVALDACHLPGEFHKDPADRIIVATARTNDLRLVTKDDKILNYPHVNTIW